MVLKKGAKHYRDALVQRVAKQLAQVPKKKKGKKKKKKMPKLSAVSAIDTAPVAIGNSIKGSSAQVITSKNGAIVRSRDFMFTAKGSGAVTTWTTVGGTPITPAAFVDSTIRQFMQMYQKYKWRYLAVHYITSSPTSSNGDVLFYHQKNRESVYLNQTSAQFLPFVLSDDDTVLGPQWTNHTAVLNVNGRWKSTDYGMTSELEQYADGDLFLLSKTSTTDSPGYVLFDYEVEFSELQTAPRLLTLPIARIQWFNTNVQISGAQTAGSSARLSIAGNDISGTTATNPSGLSNGDLYKVIFDVTNGVLVNGAWTNCTTANLFRIEEPNGYNALTIQDGTTVYALYNGSTFQFYPTVEAVYNPQSSISSLTWGVTATITANIIVWMSFIGQLGSVNLNPNF